VIQTGYR
jgi:hypothetical protein